MAARAGRPLSELAAHVGGEVWGDASIAIAGVNGLAEAKPDELSFYGSPRYKRQLLETRAAAVLITADAPRREGVAYVKVGNPHLAFARISALFHPRPTFRPGVSAGAQVHPQAIVHPQATVMAGATVERGAQVGARTALFPGVYLGEQAVVGEDCTLYPNVTVRERCVVGSRVTLHASCVVGADGFGFALDLEVPEHVKVPQAGIARIEDDVELGACTCVDRATTGETVIGRGSKVDNLVQIAHNVRVGPMSLLCAQAGVSGSTELGAGVVLAGQVGVVGHIRIGDMAKIGAQSGVAQDVPDGAVMSGSPAFDHKRWLRSSVEFERLSELSREVRQLRRRLEALEKSREESGR
ncbi:MAG: UDP-3-O-(3-hydroxymyristoyl)glucosamine N-acyltransferase [Myxococcales bacterium]|nr:UDP-3-O-(3-hydroxymyristoyl)glucosamine N-acyltransferase [Myxococcales bacterium]